MIPIVNAIKNDIKYCHLNPFFVASLNSVGKVPLNNPTNTIEIPKGNLCKKYSMMLLKINVPSKIPRPIGIKYFMLFL